ncbi:ASCH domain-containing protein [Nonomuraea sp. MCN248]|uniref:ASCH domain-containing protein n=1 Tax=Nonomuraea corallina TaxID=2989783 RepID=A0ABT4S4A9_9ACTN|nr:carbamoyltransferase C-terminal domain-containing protein [Nonomuraea corallina]MDA0632034.1 ASCH domain-containing protein [Nonomuraea corallina]
MKIIGVNKGSTLSGKALRLGGTAVFDDGSLVALGEERASGKKYAGGYSASLTALVEQGCVDLDAVDHIAVSTCCESRSAALTGHPLEGDERVRAVGHHYSHACLAYFGSGLDSALVVVADGGGNTLSEGEAPTGRWWEQPREQISYYVGSGGRLELLGRDFEAPFAVGPGEMYRAFTYFLGWHSSAYASRTMALAGHGRRGALKGGLFELDGAGGLVSPLVNDPAEPIGMIDRLGRALGLDFGEPRVPGQAILRIHRDVAAFVQNAIEDAFVRKLAWLRKRVNIDRLCLAGGIAHNVVLNGRLIDLFPSGVHVPSAPGDEGQCLGNVYATLADIGLSSSLPLLAKSSTVCIGPPVKIDSTSVAGSLKDAGLSSYVVFETSDFSRLMGGFLASGGVVCVYQARSEFGPRALGSRSILADPRRADVTSELNALKRRDWFMPFAPTVLRGRMDQWFAPAHDSPFMSFALRATPEAVRELPAVVNADGTSRVQTVDEDDGEAITRILSSFAEQTGIPVLLNTSFNAGGEPIVETLPQALEAFRDMPINVLGIGRFIVVKSLSPMLADLPLEGSLRALDLRVSAAGEEMVFEADHLPVSSVIRRLQLMTDSVVFVRTELPLYGPYLTWLREGRKVTTIRFRKGAVEIPISDVLPLFETYDYSPGDRTTPAEHVRVSGIRYQRFGDLTRVDAERDGFKSLDHMRHDLGEIYPALTDDSWVSIYDISLADPREKG